jgi:hypothetical protein
VFCKPFSRVFKLKSRHESVAERKKWPRTGPEEKSASTTSTKPAAAQQLQEAQYGQPDVSAPWAENYRSIDNINEADRWSRRKGERSWSRSCQVELCLEMRRTDESQVQLGTEEKDLKSKLIEKEVLLNWKIRELRTA